MQQKREDMVEIISKKYKHAKYWKFCSLHFEY